jgi:8-oxo-dGTP pyrophosphatase MutT (NUDIX family)
MNENSSGIIVFKKELGKRKYLLLHYKYMGDYWDFPRGNIKKDENTIQAAIRETKEETGLSKDDLIIIDGFKEKIKWLYKFNSQMVHKQVTYYIAKSKKSDVKISKEHIGFKWLDFNDSLMILKYKNSKHVLLKTETFLQNLQKELLTNNQILKKNI